MKVRIVEWKSTRVQIWRAVIWREERRKDSEDRANIGPKIGKVEGFGIEG